MMGIREKLNRHPAVAVVSAVLISGVAVAAMLISNRDLSQVRVSSAYYSVDDGKTFFADDVDRIYPFDHQGKQAFRVYVYQCDGRSPEVSYLARYEESTRVKMEKLKGNSSPDAVAELNSLIGTGIEVKKPGGAKWVPMFGGEGQSITMHPTCSDGSTAKAVNP